MKQDQLTSLPMKWSLQNLIKLSDSDKIIKHLKTELSQVEHQLDSEALSAELIKSLQHISSEIHQLTSFATCLFAENTQNLKAYSLQNISKELQAHLEKIMHRLGEKLAALSDAEFHKMLQTPSVSEVSFYLKEKREQIKDKLPLVFETLITDLSIDGYHGFSKLYETLLGTLSFEINGEKLSIAQMDNLLHDLKEEKRHEAFQEYKRVFKAHESLFAEILNHISGYRLKIYEKRGWNNFLDEPLKENRMTNQTLETMWNAIDRHIQPLCDYLYRKAKLLGVHNLGWLDVDHPLSKNASLTSFDEASQTIFNEFRHFSPKMASFSLSAIKQGWVEAENRPHKYAGGFCISFPQSLESRIFMTYSGSQNNISTLAHELGHGYHNEILCKLPYFAQDIKMNVAETASTMAEMLLSDGLLSKATTKEKKIALLDDKLSRAVAFLMNIRARFKFEKAFYEERKKGYVNAEKLTGLMLNAQKESYHNLLGEWHPHFWASKIHFYFTDVPFYNFPYTFGYLFSLGIYASLRGTPEKFQSIFDDLLHDTALMTVEDLAKKHLKVNLEEPHFWNQALLKIKEDVDEFLKLTS